MPESCSSTALVYYDIFLYYDKFFGGKSKKLTCYRPTLYIKAYVICSLKEVSIYCMFIVKQNQAKIEFNYFCQCVVTQTQAMRRQCDETYALQHPTATHTKPVDSEKPNQFAKFL